MATATFANPWHDEVGRFAPKGSGTMHPLAEQMADWETTKPWNLTKEDAIAGNVPGFRHKDARETETASWDGKHIRTTDEFYALPEETRRAIAYHEAGHAMLEAAGGLTTIDDPLGLIDKPGGQALGHNAEEIMAEGYSALWSDPDWFDRMNAHEIRTIVLDAANRAGFPLPRDVTPDEYNVDVWKPPPTGPAATSRAVQQSTATSAVSTSTTTPSTTSAPTRAGSSSVPSLGSRNVCGSSARASFANPWHDEIGRFAPKGTGRKFGASQDEMRSLFDPVRPLVDVLEGAGAKTYLVGGSVRDRLLGIDAKDIDIEVHDMSVEDTIRMLEEQGARVDEVGKAFGVLKVTFNGETHDFSFPRTEVKTGEGHTGFDVTVDPNLGIEQALARRDFTMNALAVDSDGNLVDPFNGVEDLRNGVLRHVGPAFSEDPLRILRGVQFAARMGLHFDPDTAKLARDLLPELENISTERVWGEFAKLGMKGVSMQAAAKALTDVGLDSRYGNIEFTREPDLSGLDGDHRAAVALTSIGVDPKAIGAPNTVSRAMRDIDAALAFNGDQAMSRSAARDMKYGSFADAARIAGPNDNVDPRVLEGPLPALVSGNDVMARGVRGPAIGEILRRVQQAQDNETINTREEALAWLDRNAEASTRRAEFGNPWHDEVGKFAPKGTGKKYGHGEGEDDSRPSLADRHDLDPAALTEEERLAKKRYDSFYVFETAQLEDAQSRAVDKAKHVPKPTEDDVIQGQVDALLAREGLVRAGGDRRGNNTARKRRAKQLVEEFGDGETCPCVDCGQRLAADTATAEKLGIDTLTQDKILVGTLGGSYKIENLIPACGPCNQSRGDREGVGVVGDVRQSWGSPERFTRQVVRENGDAIAQRFQERRTEILDRKGISWEEHLAANPDALPQDWDQLRRPVGGNFAATVDRFDRGAIDSDAVHHELGVRDAVRVDRVGQQRPLDGGVVDGVVEAVESVVPAEPFGSHHRAVRRNHRHQGSFANPWHDELGKFAPKGEGTNAETAPPAEDYHYSMRPDETGPRISDMADVYADVLDNPRNYTGFPEYVPETIRQLRKAATDPHAEVTVYRAAPPGAKLNDGDWVTLSKSYAETHAQAQDSGGNNPLEVMAVKVPAGAIRWAQNDIMEWGYFPNTVDDNLTASAAQFANPWHDEIGRFAPKGTGRQFGKNVSWHVGSNGYEVMHNGQWVRTPEAIKHYGAIEVAEHMKPLEARQLRDELADQTLEGQGETDVTYRASGSIYGLLYEPDLHGKEGFDQIIAAGKYVKNINLGLAMQLYAAEQFASWKESGVDIEPLKAATRAHMRGEIDDAALSKMITDNYGITVESGAVGWFNRAWQISAVSHESSAMQLQIAELRGLNEADAAMRQYVHETTLNKAKDLTWSLGATINAVTEAHQRNTQEKLSQAPELALPRIHRGVKGEQFTAIQAGDVVQGNPLSSWSFDPNQAKHFATNFVDTDGIVITADFDPANTLTISDISGMGSLDEREVIMIGKPITVTRAEVHRARRPVAAAVTPAKTYLIDTPENVDWITREPLVASGRIAFANPWHDEIGRFAPKGTGRKFVGGEVIDDEQADADFEDEYGNERPSGEGDCFPAALHYMYEVPRAERDRYRLVHGVPEGQGPIEGLRFDHAWVERTDPLPEQLDEETRKRWQALGMDVVVIDKSNGNNIEMPRVLYYQLGNIEEKDVKRYTFDEAATQAIRTKHYGPWT